MIKAHIDRKSDKNELELQGDIQTLFGESTYIIAKIYSVACEADPECGEAFKRGVQKAIADNSSPVWIFGKVKKDLVEDLESIVAKLRSVLGL